MGRAGGGSGPSGGSNFGKCPIMSHRFGDRTSRKLLTQSNLTQKTQAFDRPAKQVPFWAILGHWSFKVPFSSMKILSTRPPKILSRGSPKLYHFPG
jgi:hypothetical protein